MNDFTDKEIADSTSQNNQHATYIVFVILILIRRVSIEEKIIKLNAGLDSNHIFCFSLNVRKEYLTFNYFCLVIS
jgi:hypothetical protein